MLAFPRGLAHGRGPRLAPGLFSLGTKQGCGSNSPSTYLLVAQLHRLAGWVMGWTDGQEVLTQYLQRYVPNSLGPVRPAAMRGPATVSMARPRTMQDASVHVIVSACYM